MAKFFLFPFAATGDKTAIPDDTQPSGSVSYEIGFGIDYQKDLATDPQARPIPRDQFNQLMYDVTNAIRQYQTEGTPDFITTGDNGGSPFPYDIFARVRYNPGGGVNIYESLQSANTALPTDITKWRVISNNLDGVQAGTIIDWAGLVPPSGYIVCDGSTLVRATYPVLFQNITTVETGNTSNGLATITGLSDTLILHVGMAVEGAGVQAGATILTIDSGSQVTLSSTCTATATVPIRFFPWGNGNGTTSFNLPDLRRRTTIGVGGTASTDPLGIGNKIGQVGGEESHTPTEAEMFQHNHTTTNIQASSSGAVGGFIMTSTNTNSTTLAATVANRGGSVAFNIIQPSAVTYKCIKTV